MAIRKYKSKRPKYNGITFDSNAELARYKELVALQSKGVISGLELQKRYDLNVLGFKICSYIADFVYIRDNETIVEDVKGVLTPIFRLKYKLMYACHGIKILLTQAVYRQKNKVKFVAGFREIKGILPKEIKKS